MNVCGPQPMYMKHEAAFSQQNIHLIAPVETRALFTHKDISERPILIQCCLLLQGNPGLPGERGEAGPRVSNVGVPLPRQTIVNST
jgi:hypothetical protein